MVRGARFRALLALLALVPLSATSAGMASRARARGNPIQKVVQMLGMMQKKVEEAGRTELVLFDRYMCYCKTGLGELEKSVKDAEEKIPQLESDIEEAVSTVAQLTEELKQHKTDKAEAESTVEKATAVRNKEHTDFETESNEFRVNIEALSKAIPLIRSGMAGFLQTGLAQTLRKLATTADLSSDDSNALSAFLSEGNGEGYAPQSGEILGILEQLKEAMEKDLQEAIAAEASAQKGYDELMAAKKEEIASATSAIETKTAIVGDTNVQIANLREDLDDTKTALEKDTKYLSEMNKSCKAKDEEWAVRSQTRAQELAAIADTIKILNDDATRNLFKDSLPVPPPAPVSFLQVREAGSSPASRQEALRLLRAAQAGAGTAGSSVQLNLIALALRGKKVGFEKLVAMIEDMIGFLKVEQSDDDKKRKYCKTELNKSEDKGKELAQTISDLGAAIEENVGKSTNLAEEIATLVQGIKDLDALVAEATEQRKEENAEFTRTQASNHAALDIIHIAKNRLKAFYDAVAPAPTVLAQVDESRDAPAPPPETFGAYEKDAGGKGVVAMMDTLSEDIEKEMQEAQSEEKSSQQEYEFLMKDSSDKRATDASTIAEKEGQKAGLEEELHKQRGEKKAKQAEDATLKEYVGNLHQECDWLLDNYAERKKARTSESDALHRAKGVLSGADFSA